MPRFLSLQLPRWPIQRWRRESEHEASSAILLYGESHRGLRVVACCPAASRQGVRPGMPLTEAMSLAVAARRKPSGNVGQASCLPETASRKLTPQIAKYDPAADEQALHQLALECELFSPLIGIEEADPPAGLLFDVTGLAKHFGGEPALAERVVAHLKQRRYACRVAIAETIGMAWGAARYGGQPVRCIEAGDSTVERLPIDALRLKPDTATTLHSLGIHRIGQLTALPRRELRSRFDDDLLLRLWQWRGEVPEVIRPVERPLVIEAGTELEYVISEREGVAFFIGELLPKIVKSLAEHRLGATELECLLRGERGDSGTLKIGFREPCLDADRMRQLLRLQLEGALLPADVQSIRLRVTRYAELTTHQTTMFDSPAGESHELTQLIDMLSARLGERQVTRPCLREEHQPEYAFSTPPAIHIALPRKVALTARLRPGMRPLWLVHPPESLEDLTLTAAGTPWEFVYRRERHRVACCSAAETIETAWWRGATVRRDYHRVRTRSGSSFWLFRTLDDDRWFLQGEFL